MSNKNLRKLYLSQNLDELRIQADKVHSINPAQYNDLMICSKILKLYDEALNLLGIETSSNSIGHEEIDQELAYVYLWRFIQMCIKVVQSKIYKNDPIYIDSMLSSIKQAKALKLLEKLQQSLKNRYAELNGDQDLKDIEKLNLESVEEKAKSESVVKTTVIEDNEIREIIDKKFINSKELLRIIEKTKFKLFIIDCRTIQEFNSAHMDFSYLKQSESTVSFINLNSDHISPGLVLWNLEDKLRKENNFEFLDLLARRSSFDYLIIFDFKSTKNDFNESDNKLSIVKRAFYDFDEIEMRCKNEPLILNGGWLEWITYYPAFKKKNANAVSTDLVLKPANEMIASLDSVSSLDAPLTDDDTVNLAPQAKVETESDDENESFPITYVKPIPSVNRKNKPPVVLNNRPVETTTIQQPVNSFIHQQPISQLIQQPPINQPQQITNSFIQRPINPSVQPVSQPLNSFMQKPPVIQPAISLIQQQPMLFERRNNNIFLNQVYKPQDDNIYFVKPVKSSKMNNGIVKFLNPITGMLDHVYDEGNQVEYTPSDILPQTVLNVNRELKKQPLVKPVIPDRKTKIIEEAKPPQPTLKRTFSSPNIEKLVDSDSESDEDNTKKPNDSPVLTQKNSTIVKPMQSPVAPSMLNKQPENSAPPVNQSSTVAAPKPNVRRESKPMPENIKRLRLENLEPQWSNVHPGLTGIRNLGNTCFMNSIIQCLNNTVELKEYFLSDRYRNDLNPKNPLGFGGEIADEFSIIVNALWWGHCKTIAPTRFKELIGQFNSQFVANDQQDAQEFLLFLLDGLHEDLNKVIERPRNLPEINYDILDDTEGARKAWEHHKKLNNSIIVDLFQGQFRSILACMTCGKQSVKFDAFMYLTLPVPSSRCSLNDCLTEFLKPEKMSGESKWKCPQCKVYREAAKKIDIWSLPRLLIVHLKRFKYQGVWRDKIKTVVDYPIDNLNLTKFLPPKTSSRFTNYKLFAISNHTGTLDGGHYTALCKNEKTNRWFKYDDSTVKEADTDSIRSNPTSYILFYASI